MYDGQAKSRLSLGRKKAVANCYIIIECENICMTTKIRIFKEIVYSVTRFQLVKETCNTSVLTILKSLH